MSEEIIRARIDTDLKKAFDEACERNDLTSSQVLRSMIREYVAKNAQADLLKPKKSR